jgi:hypothetical protein
LISKGGIKGGFRTMNLILKNINTKNSPPPMSKSLPSFVLPLTIESESDKEIFANSLG